MLARTAVRTIPRRAFSTSAPRQTKVAVLGAGGMFIFQITISFGNGYITGYKMLITILFRWHWPAIVPLVEDGSSRLVALVVRYPWCPRCCC